MALSFVTEFKLVLSALALRFAGTGRHQLSMFESKVIIIFKLTPEI